MSRKYVKINEHGKEILELKREGKTNREIRQRVHQKLGNSVQSAAAEADGRYQATPKRQTSERCSAKRYCRRASI